MTAEWMTKEFIPVYRRMFDGLTGRGTRHRALEAANRLLDGEIELDDVVPDELRTSFYEMNLALVHGDREGVKAIVDTAEQRLMEYRKTH